MVMTKDTAKKTAKEGERSSPTARRAGKASPALPAGGGCGRKKLHSPRTTEKPAASNRGRLVSSGLLSLKNKGKTLPTMRLATIQPMVPSTRMDGKSRAPLGTWLKVIELDSTRVGE